MMRRGGGEIISVACSSKFRTQTVFPEPVIPATKAVKGCSS